MKIRNFVYFLNFDYESFVVYFIDLKIEEPYV